MALLPSVTDQYPGEDLWGRKVPMFNGFVLVSAMEQRALCSRPFRRAVISILGLLAVGWLALSRQWRSVELAEQIVQTGHWHHAPSHWVGGGAVIAQTIPEAPRIIPEPDSSTLETHQPPLHPLPNLIRIPFEEAVKDIKLEGWEAQWFSMGHYDKEQFGLLEEPKIDFVYNWVNGSDPAFNEKRHIYELQSPLNDARGEWIARHGVNRYRDWDELRYSLRSLNAHAQGFVNNILILVNSVNDYLSAGEEPKLLPQRPTWLKDDEQTDSHIHVLSQEAFYGEQERACLPTFNSLSIESQLHMTPSEKDQFVALSDDMFLGMDHTASDFYSPLFGPVIGFKSDHYNVKSLGHSMPSFGEKPFLHYTSWLMNHRFGSRNRHVQAHFTHSLSRAVMAEAMAAFPQPSHDSACQRFRGELKYQIQPWFLAFHYSIERFREALLWSYITMRADANGDGYLDLQERRQVLENLEPGRSELGHGDSSKPAAQAANRDRLYYKLPEILRDAGLEAPKVNLNVLWTSADGPETIRGVKCSDFNIDKCLGDSFDSTLSDSTSRNPDFATSNLFSRLSSQHPSCGDCLLKFILASTPRGLEPLLPTKPADRELIIKALKKYQQTIIDTDGMKFVMVKDAEQAEQELLERTVRRGKSFGQWCLNDDVMTDNEEEIGRIRNTMQQVFETLWPDRTDFER